MSAKKKTTSAGKKPASAGKKGTPAMKMTPVPAALRKVDAKTSEKSHPGADAVVVEDRLTIRLDGKGKVTRHQYRLKKILLPWDRDQRSDLLLPFYDDCQEVEIHRVRGFLADGTATDTPEYGINQTTPAGVGKAPHFGNLQHQVVSAVGIERGGATEVEWEIRDRKKWRRAFEGAEPICLEWPVLSRTVTFEVPEKQSLRFVAGSDAEFPVAEPEISEGDGVRRIVFRFRDLPAWSTTEGNPVGRAECPVILYGSDEDWEDAAAAMGKVVDRVRIVDEAMERLVDDELEDLVLPGEKIAKLHEHVVKAVATVSLPEGAERFQPRPAPEVLASGYGSPFEKAILLAALLEGAGFPAEVFLACPQAAFCEDAVVLEQYEACWVWVPGLDAFLRPDRSEDKARREHLEDHEILVLSSEEPWRVLLTGPGTPMGNLWDGRLSLSVKDGLVLAGTGRFVLSGQANPYHALRDADGKKVRAWAKGLVGGVWAGLDVKEHRFDRFGEDVSALHVEVEGPAVQADGDGEFVVTLPGALGPMKDFKAPEGLADRPYAVSLPGSYRQELCLDLDIGSELELLQSPRKVEIDGGVGQWSASFGPKPEKGTTAKSKKGNGGKKDEKGRVWRWSTRLFLPERHQGSESYRELRTLLETLAKDGPRSLFLGRRPR